MKTILSFGLFLLISISSMSQISFLTMSDSTKWNIKRFQTLPDSSVGTITVISNDYTFLEKDTFFAGQNYIKVKYITNYQSSNEVISSFFVRHNEQQVYGRINNDTSDTEKLLYDFDAVQGDTVFALLIYPYPFVNSSKTAMYIVDTIVNNTIWQMRIIAYDDYNIKTYEGYVRWDKLIGSMNNPFFHFNFETLYYAGRDYLTLCVEKNNLNVYMYSPSLGCLASTGINTPIEENSIKVYPNPANNLINIDLGYIKNNIIEIEIFNSIGQKQISQQIDNNINIQQINIEKLNTGIYFYRIKRGNNLQLSGKFIKN